MKLSPLDIQHQEFDSAVNGYKKRQVHEFLERVADTFEELLRDNQSLRDALNEQRERNEELQVGELELRRAVVSAERIGNEMKERAQKEAELIVEQAKTERGNILQDAEAGLGEVKAELARTEREHRLFREQFRGMLRAYERSLDAQPELRRGARGEEPSRSRAPEEAEAQEGVAQDTPHDAQPQNGKSDRRTSGVSVILEPDD